MTSTGSIGAQQLPAIIQACVVKQRDREPSNGTGQPAVPADSVVTTYDSYNPRWVKVVVKQGLNPTVPLGAEVISKELDERSGAITITCGILNPGSENRGVETSMTNSDEVAAAANANIVAMGMAGLNPLSAAASQAQAGSAPSTLTNTTFSTTTNYVPQTALDVNRATSSKVAALASNLSSIFNTDPGIALSNAATGAGDAIDTNQPAIRQFSSGIMSDEPGSNSYLIIIIVIVVILSALTVGWFMWLRKDPNDPVRKWLDWLSYF
jgi:cobalamin biosynthesis Mg chelatase CobN